MTDNQIGQDHPVVNENTYRIRAAVRAIMSPGMWLAVFLFALTAIQNPLMTGKNTGPEQSSILFHLTLFALLFVMSGLFQSLASGSGVVSVKDVLKNSPPVFGRYLLLIIKAAFVFIILPVMLLVSLMGGAEEIASYYWMLSVMYELAILIAIYWLPVAFVTGRFGLMQTIGTALQVQMQRLKQLPFIAVLLLAPNLTGLLVRSSEPMIAILTISIIGEVLGWIAYTYCIEYLVRRRNEAAAVVSG